MPGFVTEVRRDEVELKATGDTQQFEEKGPEQQFRSDVKASGNLFYPATFGPGQTYLHGGISVATLRTGTR